MNYVVIIGWDNTNWMKKLQEQKKNCILATIITLPINNTSTKVAP
nr:hypothetical protein [uncultured Bacteroides sp.]